MHIYADKAYCFVCGFICPSEEVASAEELKKIKRDPTDIRSAIEFIETLPKKYIRGLKLHFDDSGYYIIWPTREFYKKRMSFGKIRYMGPRGHKVPLLKFVGQARGALIVVEGEMNALSLEHCKVTKATIVSPGSATELVKHLDYYLTFDSIVVIVDRDAAGVAHGLTLKKLLIKSKKKVQLVACEKDINQILQEEERQGVKDWFEKEVDLF